MPWMPLPDVDSWAPHRVGDDLDKVLRSAGGTAAAAVWARWAEAVGAGLASHARPVALHGTTLVVAVDSPAYAAQLRLLAAKLLGRLSEIAGPGVICGVEVTVRP